MPQAAPQRNQKPAARSNAKPQPAAETAPQAAEDHVYGLVSVLYHALQGSQACAQYIADARSANDDELVQFFTEAREEQQQRAIRAQRLLAQRSDTEDDEDEDEDDEDEDEDDS